MVQQREKIVTVKRDRARKATLPKDRTFYPKYKRVKRNLLPDNVTIKNIQKKEEKETKQQDEGLGNIPKNSFFLAKKIAKSKNKRDLLKIAIKKALDIYSKNVRRMKNKRHKRILNSDLASTAQDSRLRSVYNNIKL